MATLKLHCSWEAPPSGVLTNNPLIGPPVTLDRSTIAMIDDHEGILRQVDVDEPRFKGGRRVENLMLGSGNLKSADAAWTQTNLSGSGTFTENADGSITIANNASGDRLYMSQLVALVTGRTYTLSANILAISGYPFNGNNFRETGGSLAVNFTSSDLGRAQFGTFTATSSGLKTFRFGIGCGSAETLSTSGSITFSDLQIEDVSGQGDQTPSEYQATTTAVTSSWYSVDQSGSDLSNVQRYIEESRENVSIRSEDASNVAWVASNVTKGTTSAETPNGGNSTTVRLTASAGNGTLLQSITDASADRSYAVYLKRITGTGNIDITMDGGSTWTTQSTTASWVRFEIQQTSVTNPQIGVRIVTSGDAIDFWGSDIEEGPNSTTYKPTVASSFARAADDTSITDLSYMDQTKGTYYIKYTSNHGAASFRAMDITDGTNSERYAFYGVLAGSLVDPAILISDGGATQVSLTATAANVPLGTATAQVVAYEANDFAHAVDGGTVATDGAGTLPTVDRIFIGRLSSASTNYINGGVAEIRYYDEALQDSVQDISNGIFPAESNPRLIGVPSRDVTRNVTRSVTDSF